MVTRREVLRGAAAAGGLVWVAPVVESFSNTAAAQSTLPYGTCCQCLGALEAGPYNPYGATEDFGGDCAAYCKDKQQGWTWILWSGSGVYAHQDGYCMSSGGYSTTYADQCLCDGCQPGALSMQQATTGPLGPTCDKWPINNGGCPTSTYDLRYDWAWPPDDLTCASGST